LFSIGFTNKGYDSYNIIKMGARKKKLKAIKTFAEAWQSWPLCLVFILEDLEVHIWAWVIF
jgi:hypothetical protein